MSRLIDLTGKVFGRLKVIERAANIGKQTAWLCECSCDKHTRLVVTGGNLKSQHTTSCGCYCIERTKEGNKQFRKQNIYIDKGEYLEGYDAKGNSFTIDKEDYEIVSQFYWGFNKATNYWTAFRTIDGKKYGYKLHQIICPALSNEVEADHYDQNTSNNRRNNLILKSHRENSINSGLQSNNSSGIIGVNFAPSENRWRATISHSNGCQRIVGRFLTKEEATICRLVYEYYYYKENAPQRDMFKEYGIDDSFVNEYMEKNKKRKNNVSGVIGVHYNKKENKWWAYISLNKKLKHLGVFVNKDDAVRTRLMAEKEYYKPSKQQKDLWKEYGIE